MTTMTAVERYRHLEQQLSKLIPSYKFSKEINLKLERVTRLLQLLGDPHLQYPVIHIGGTSGKGSTCTMTAAILHQAGYKVGLDSSPHLQLLNERHQINGVVAPTSHLLALYEQKVWPAIQQVGRELPQFGPPTYFEAQFALGACYFAQQQVDVAVIEVGLGGKLDATNVVQSQVAVLTSVGLDHVEILGHTIEEIITDKSHIIKPKQIVITGVTQPSAHAIISTRAADMGNQLWSLGHEIAVTSQEDGLRIRVQDREIGRISLGLQGDFQHHNAACAVAAALAFAPTLSDETIRTALAQVRFPGRMEEVQTKPRVILDGAHNPDKMHASASGMAKQGRTIAVFALKGDKDVQEVLHWLLPHLDAIVVTEFYAKGLWSPLSAELLAETVHQLAPTLPLTILADPRQAVRWALLNCEEEDTIWVTGSLYLIGDVRSEWYPTEQLIEQAEHGLSADLRITNF